MAKALWIAEKRSLAEAVGNVLGTPARPWDDKGLTSNAVGDHEFVFLDGHAFRQAMPDHYLSDDVPLAANGRKRWRKEDLPIVPKTWALLPDERKLRRLDRLAQLLKTCNVVYHLGDPDAEGQVIVDEALAFYGNTKPVMRVLVNDYNTTKIREALSNVRRNDEPMFRALYLWGLARSRYDWLLGLNATRALTLRGRELGFDRVLPVGSVQTPLLFIVRERDAVIENFRPVGYFTLSAELRHANGSFRAQWKAGQAQAGLDDEGRLVDREIAQALAARLTGKPGTITRYDKERKAQKPPLTLSMTELQFEGFKRYGYTGMQVLDAAQRLYETYKVMTYPRSDNRYLSEAQHLTAPAVFDAVYRLRPDLAQFRRSIDSRRKSAAFDDRKMAGTPHHGIVPTIPEIAVDMASWSDMERNVYDMVVRSYLAQFALPYEYMQTSVAAMVDGEQFTATGRTPIAQGWKVIFAEVPDDTEAKAESDDSAQLLPPMAQGDPAACEKCTLTPRKTTPPPRFNDGTLLDAMANVSKYVPDAEASARLKEVGIGTTATRAGIVEDLKTRELLVPVKPGSPQFMTSETARTLIDALPMDVKDPTRAGVFKLRLDSVAKGDLTYDDFMRQTVAWISEVVDKAGALSMQLPVKAGTVMCPKCKGAPLRRKEKDQGAFWFCGNWNREEDPCTARFSDVAGKPMLEAHRCPKCATGTLRRRQRDKGGAFWFCTNWNNEAAKCPAVFEEKAGKPHLVVHTCPICKQGDLRSVPGKNGRFWGCSRFQLGCEAAFPDKGGKPDLALKPVYSCSVCKQGELRSITGKNGKFWGCNRYNLGCKATYPDNKNKPDLLVKTKSRTP